MPDPRCPYARWNPGVAAGYSLTYDQRDGHNLMRVGKCHYTVGVNSTGRGLEGYFQILVSRDGSVQQFAEIDAYCMDSAQGNKWGPGIEVEYHPDYDATIFTDVQRDATRAVREWLTAEWGIPSSYYDGDRISLATYTGFISHRSILQTDPHNDYWPAEDAAVIFAPPAPAPPPPTEETGDMWGINWVNLDGTCQLLVCGGPYVVIDLNGAAGQPYDLPLAELEYIGFSIDGITIRKVQPERGNQIQQKARAATGIT